MEAAVVVALVTSIFSAIVSASTAVWTTRKHTTAQRALSDKEHAAQVELEKLKDDLQRAVRQEARQLEAAEQLERYRVPLLEAANDLRHRLRNIRDGGFTFYFTVKGPRQQTAVNTTLYRLSRYFATLELMYSNTGYLGFETAEETRAVHGLLKQIGTTFASDTYDVGRSTARYMIWREEQRAMGELALDVRTNGTVEIVGYATFDDRLSKGASRWFATLANDLTAFDAAESERLDRVERLLADLVRLLDKEGRYAA